MPALAIFPDFEARRITVAIEEFLDTLTRGANMMRAIGLLALLAVLDVGAASAQMEAPIGHRQPRASEVPNENSINNPNDPLNKENAALDRTIKSICRGCENEQPQQAMHGKNKKGRRKAGPLRGPSIN